MSVLAHLPVSIRMDVRDGAVRAWKMIRQNQEVQVNVCFECEVLRMDLLGVSMATARGPISRGLLSVVKRQVTSAFPDEMLHRSQVHVGIQNLQGGAETT